MGLVDCVRERGARGGDSLMAADAAHTRRQFSKAKYVRRREERRAAFRDFSDVTRGERVGERIYTL